jgi:predicted secreted protein
MITLQESDIGRTVDVGIGQRVTIRLIGNVSAGYFWTLTTFDFGVLTMLGEAAYSRTSAAGASCIETWSFCANRRGRKELRFEYRCPSARSAPVAQIAQYTINVL